jgi:hypothetical protein
VSGAVRHDAVRFFVIPMLYAIGVVPVAIGVLWVLLFVEYRIGFYSPEPGFGLDNLVTLYFNGDVAGAVAIVAIGAPVFALLGWGLGRLGGVQQPTLGDHLCRCAFLYAFVVILGAMFAVELARNLALGKPMYEVPLVVGIWLVAGFGIFMDAVVLLLKRQHAQHTEHGGAA